MKRIAIALLAGIAAVAGLGHGASAADLAIPPPPPPAPSWTGFYVGVHAGAAWQSGSDWTFTDPNGSFFPGTQTLSNTGSTLRLGVLVASRPATTGNSPPPGWQASKATSPGRRSPITGRSTRRLTVPPPLHSAGYQHVNDHHCSMAVERPGQARFRRLVEHDVLCNWWRSLCGHRLFRANNARGTRGDRLQPQQSNFNHTTTKTGWVAGAGAEWMATTNILLRVEYLYYGIDSGTDGSAQLLPILFVGGCPRCSTPQLQLDQRKHSGPPGRG